MTCFSLTVVTAALFLLEGAEADSYWREYSVLSFLQLAVGGRESVPRLRTQLSLSMAPLGSKGRFHSSCFPFSYGISLVQRVKEGKAVFILVGDMLRLLLHDL